MSPKSRKQQKTAGMAVAMKKGKMPMKPGPAAEMANSMSVKSVREMATMDSGSTKKLPLRAKPKPKGRIVSE